jgi:glycosyltransferase involved in cell wall biosynthesis
VAVINSIGFESFSYSTLEAMAAARPTIVTRVGALPELIDHEHSGLITTPDEPHELASCIERFLDEPDFARRCGCAAHATARDCYDTRRVLPMMLEAYEQAAEFFYKDRAMPVALQRLAAGPPWARELIAS